MFNFFKKKGDGLRIGAPIAGKSIPLSEVNDPTFSGELIGKGVAIIPDSNTVVAPSDGTIVGVFPTLHAITMQSNDGAEILIHIGIDTVNMKGEGFKKIVEDNAAVKKGDSLIEVDFKKVEDAGYDKTVMMVICNTANYTSVEAITGKDVNVLDDVLVLKK